MWPRRTRTDASSDAGHLDDLARALLIEEHASLRAEILASYGYAQSIVKWTLATFAAVMAAGLIAIYNANSDVNNVMLFYVVLAIFGGGLPGIIWLSAWTWLGELYRAERAGSYLRALESDLDAVKGLSDRLGFQPARWESFIFDNRKSKGLWGKQTITYLGTAGVFFGAVLGSLLVFVLSWVHVVAIGVLVPGEGAWLWIAGAAVLSVAGLAGCGVIYTRLMKLGEAIAPVAARYPKTV